MNEPAIRTEEQIISLFPDRETFVCRGWVLKRMGGQLWVYPLYYKFSEGDIAENVRRCEEISRQYGAECVFRIVEHTNYHLSAILTDAGYVLLECGVVGELYLPDSESCFNRVGKGQDGLSLRKGADDGSVEYIVAEGGMVIGIKRRELLFLLDGKLLDDVTLENVLQFSKVNGIKNVLADIPETEKLPEEYERVGFQRSYLYRCYQMEDIRNGFTE